MQPAVLVVDDDVNLQPLLHVLLSRAGYAVEFATDGPSGLQKLQNATYDAILLDLLLPRATGIDLLHTLKREKPQLMPKVIVLSGASAHALEAAKHFPVHRIIRKPFDIVELVREVESCSGKKDV